MASTSVRTPETAPPLPPNGRRTQAKRAAGLPRPSGEDQEDEDLLGGHETAVEAEAATVLSRKPEEFFEQLAGFTTDDWQYLIAYLYRTSPTIDRKSNGRPANIRKYVDFFDSDRIMREHGSGGYRIDLCRRNPVSGKCPRIGQLYLDIMNLDYPPRVPLGDWVDEPENNIWKWAKPSLEHAAATGHFPTQEDPNKLFDTILTGVERLRGAGSDKGDSVAAATIKQFGDMVTVLLSRPAAPPPDNTASNQIIAFLQNELSEQRKEVRSIREQLAQQQPKSFLEQMKEFVPAVSQAVEILGLKRAGKAAQTQWPDVITEVVEKLSENAPILYDLWKGAKAGDGASTGAFTLPAAAKKDAATAPKDNPGPTETSQARQEETTVPEDKRQRYQQILSQWGKLIESSAPFMLDYFRRNKTGFDFRDWLIEVHGMANFAALRGGVSAQEMTELTQLHTYLKTVMQPPDRALLYFTEFLTLPGEEPSGTVVEDE